jgi:hypothetical protein
MYQNISFVTPTFILLIEHATILGYIHLCFVLAITCSSACMK